MDRIDVVFFNLFCLTVVSFAEKFVFDLKISTFSSIFLSSVGFLFLVYHRLKFFVRFSKSACLQDHPAAEVFGNTNEEIAPFTFSFKFMREDKNPLGGISNPFLKENVGIDLGNGGYESVVPVRAQSVAAVCHHLFGLLGWGYQCQGWSHCA